MKKLALLCTMAVLAINAVVVVHETGGRASTTSRTDSEAIVEAMERGVEKGPIVIEATVVMYDEAVVTVVERTDAVEPTAEQCDGCESM
jgi:hypothetical protein